MKHYFEIAAIANKTDDISPVNTGYQLKEIPNGVGTYVCIDTGSLANFNRQVNT